MVMVECLPVCNAVPEIVDSRKIVCCFILPATLQTPAAK
jgi:hypothetical protein